jgi:hypothetical protein
MAVVERKKISIPSLGPFVAPNAVCTTCGDILKPQVVKHGVGMVSGIFYECKNEKTGCNYRATVSPAHLNCEMRVIPAEKDEKK